MWQVRRIAPRDRATCHPLASLVAPQPVNLRGLEAMAERVRAGEGTVKRARVVEDPRRDQLLQQGNEHGDEVVQGGQGG